jgi:hypothetical protein
VVIPQLEQYASTIPDSVMQVYLRLRGDAFNGIAVRLTPAIANFVASQGWVESVDLDLMIRATEPLRFAARKDAAELGARKLQSTQGAAPSTPAQPKFSQTNAPFQLDRIDQRSVDTDGEYEYSLTGQGIDVYIMDSGINAEHEGASTTPSGKIHVDSLPACHPTRAARCSPKMVAICPYRYCAKRCAEQDHAYACSACAIGPGALQNSLGA